MRFAYTLLQILLRYYSFQNRDSYSPYVQALPYIYIHHMCSLGTALYYLPGILLHIISTERGNTYWPFFLCAGAHADTTAPYVQYVHMYIPHTHPPTSR